MSEQSEKGVVFQWVKHGPRDSDGTLGWMLGMILWWRMQAISVLTMSPILAGLLVYAQFGNGWAVMVAAIVGLFAGEKTMEVSPKYNVTENY